MNNQYSQSEIVLCDIHQGELITHVCLANTCLTPLCSKCIKQHNDYHKSLNTYPEIELLEDVKKMCEVKLKSAINNFTIELDNYQLLKKAQREEEDEITKIKRAKKQLIDQIENYFNEVEERILEIKKRDKPNEDAIAHEFSTSLESMTTTLYSYYASIERNEFVKNLKDFFFTDFEGQLRQILDHNQEEERKLSKNNIEINPKFQKEFSSFLDANFKLKPQKKISISTKLKDEEGKYFKITKGNYYDNNVYKQYLHFFQHKSKFLHLLDLEESDKRQEFDFQKIELNIDFKIPRWHRSVATPYGEIYLTGGVDTENTEKKLNSAYVYDFNKRTLIPIKAMKLGRSGHALTYLDGYLYVIGGFSEDHEFTSRCERYNIRKDTWQEIASMNLPANNPCVCVFNDRYIYKFGGKINDDQLSNTIERYNPLLDRWIVINFEHPKKIGHDGEKFCLYSSAACCQISDSSIFVFGGTHINYSQKTASSFLVHIEKEEKDKKYNEEIKPSHRIVGFDLYPLPIAEAFWNNQPIIHEGNIYCLQNVQNESNTSAVYLDRRRLLRFSYPEGWKVFE